MKLPKGQYYAIDTQSPNGPGQNPPPFLTQGAFAPLKVTSGSGASLPKTSAKVTVKDEPKDRFSYNVSGLKSGTNTITFDNASKEDHHVLAVQLLPGHSLAQAQALREIVRVTGDEGFLREMLPPIKKYFQWLMANRDFDGDGLISIISPFESGIDWSPSFDPVHGIPSGIASDKLFRKVVFADLRNFLRGYNLKRIYKPFLE